MGALVPLGFLAAIAVLVFIGVVLNVYQKRATHRLMDQDSDERFAMMEARLAELEERVDSAERALATTGSRRELPSGDSR